MLQGPQGSAAAAIGAEKSNKRKKGSKAACTNCRQSHVACDRNQPCARCVSHGLQDSCQYLPRKRRTNFKKQKKGSSSDESVESPSPQPVSQQSPPIVSTFDSELVQPYADLLGLAPVFGPPQLDFAPSEVELTNINDHLAFTETDTNNTLFEHTMGADLLTDDADSAALMSQISSLLGEGSTQALVSQATPSLYQPSLDNRPHSLDPLEEALLSDTLEGEDEDEIEPQDNHDAIFGATGQDLTSGALASPATGAMTLQLLQEIKTRNEALTQLLRKSLLEIRELKRRERLRQRQFQQNAWVKDSHDMFSKIWASSGKRVRSCELPAIAIFGLASSNHGEMLQCNEQFKMMVDRPWSELSNGFKCCSLFPQRVLSVLCRTHTQIYAAGLPYTGEGDMMIVRGAGDEVAIRVYTHIIFNEKGAPMYKVIYAFRLTD